ncbi:MAG: hypothetical protein RJB66_2526 [Pseudomonadota bacterium]|jgi:hypothetical protein
MEIDRKDIHELKNQLAISMGMIELGMKMIARDQQNVDLSKLDERLNKSLEAQKKILDYLNSLKKPEPPLHE